VGGLLQKKETVAELKEQLADAAVAYVVDYRGLSVAEITAIRRDFYKNADAKLTVMKNTLLKRAIADTEMAELEQFLSGPTALAIGKSDQVAPLKILKKFFKDNKKKNEIRGAVMDGNAMAVAEVNAMADLPSLDELRGKLVGGIASPLNGIVAAISSPQRGLVNVLDQYAKHKQQQES
jgi:large subunit ribosomal protein L10